MTFNYDGKKFRPVKNSENGEVTNDMIFHYQQTGTVVSCSYNGDNIVLGHLLGLVSEAGSIDMRYHQINKMGELRTGHCHSVPEMMPNGRIRLLEKWQWTSGDRSSGESVLEEID